LCRATDFDLLISVPLYLYYYPVGRGRPQACRPSCTYSFSYPKNRIHFGCAQCRLSTSSGQALHRTDEDLSVEPLSFLEYNPYEKRIMTNLQLVLTAAIPSMLILVGIFLDNAGFNSIETRLTTMEGDLRQFYRDLGRHEAEIANIKERNRSS
jgi:hypothetical protein